jgi:hypothetical protein
MIARRRYPTPEDIQAIELAARRARAQAIACAFVAVARGLKTLIGRGAAALAGKFRRARALARHET